MSSGNILCGRNNCSCTKSVPYPEKYTCPYNKGAESKVKACNGVFHKISYRPREIVVSPTGSGKMTLDDAVDIIAPFKGGYVIHLSPGTHTLTKNISGMDRIELRGDLSTNKGVAYVQGGNYLSFITDNVVGKWMPYSPLTGNGPWNLSVNGKVVTVTGEPGRTPDFSSVCVGDRVGVIKKDKIIRHFTVAHVWDNKIELDSAPGLSPTPSPGEGLFLYPRVTFKTTSSRYVYSEKIFFRGLHMETSPLFRVGQVSGRIMYAYCVLEGNTNLDGTFECDLPNVNLGTVTGVAASHGTIVMWANIGSNVNMHFESNGFPYVIGSITSGCPVGLRLVIGGKMCVAFSQFFNCDTGAKLLGKCHLNVQGNFYHNCDVGIDVDTDSAIGSQKLPDFPFPDGAWPPKFSQCGTGFKLENRCLAHLPDISDSNFPGTPTAMVIDGLSYSSFMSYTNRTIGSRGSVVITDSV